MVAGNSCPISSEASNVEGSGLGRVVDENTKYLFLWHIKKVATLPP
jgi:hypothetical protein